MQLKISNFGKIKEAEVNLEGLTVISGQNDTGKSTIGKVLFWLINGLNNYVVDYEQQVVNFCKPQLLTIWRYLARQGHTVPKELQEFIDNSDTSALGLLSSDTKYESSNLDIRNLSTQTLQFIRENKLESDKALESDYNTLDFLVNADTNGQLMLALYRKGRSIFKGNLNNSVDKDINASIKLSTTNIDIVSLDIKNDMIDIVSFDKEEVNRLLWKNVDLIESPLMIDNGSSKKIWENKFISRMMYNETEDKEDKIDLKSIIDASIVIDKKSKSINYQKDNTAKKLDILNIASGAKSFFILNTLQSLGSFSTDSITVFNEPENHLHPEWQIKYAELIIDFVQKGASIVLTSHSPYMIQALIHYAKEKKIPEDKFRLLLSQKTDGNWSSIDDVTKTPNRVFEVLTKPFYKIFES